MFDANATRVSTSDVNLETQRRLSQPHSPTYTGLTLPSLPESLSCIRSCRFPLPLPLAAAVDDSSLSSVLTGTYVLLVTEREKRMLSITDLPPAEPGGIRYPESNA